MTLASPTEYRWKVVVREEKKLVSVKMRLERSFWWPWLATTVQPRQGTFASVGAWFKVFVKDVGQFFISARKNIKFFCCLISKDSKFNALVQKLLGLHSFLAYILKNPENDALPSS